MKSSLAILALFALSGIARAQDPVSWSLTLEPSSAAPGGRILAKAVATIEPGWHLYSLTTAVETNRPRLSLDGAVIEKQYQPMPKLLPDPVLPQDQEIYDGVVTYLLDVSIPADAPAGARELTFKSTYTACDDQRCLRPKTKTATATLNVNPAIRAAEPVIPDGYFDIANGSPVPPKTQAAAAPETVTDQGLARFLAVAFAYGLAAVFTPCVFPMIPITMSFFLKRQGVTRGDSIFQAGLFSLGIIVLFTTLGLATTALLGASAVRNLGSNLWVNAFIAILFAVFAVSMLGAFEITIPSSVLTKVDAASRRGGVLGTLLMGLAFSLSAFACIGPFVGTLLAASAQSGGARPAIGMATFATGLASPFFFLALFPSMLGKLPRSGGWLPRVKVVFGFLILAIMFKYLSNIDQVLQWHLLTRERFLAAWVVLFAMPGLYLLGFLNMDGVDRNERVGVARALIGAAFLAFSLSLIPGMLGGSLGDLDAYVPFAETTAGPAANAGPVWLENDYDGALAKAKAENKLVFITFTTVGCTNCHWMKARMFPRPEIQAALDNAVLVELYTDTGPQAERFAALQDKLVPNYPSVPVYAILDANENLLAHFLDYTDDTARFLAFIQSATKA